jgi:hypothetical protein
MTSKPSLPSENERASLSSLRVPPCRGGRAFWVGVMALGLLGLGGVAGAGYVGRGALARERFAREAVRCDARVLAKQTMVAMKLGPPRPSYLVTYRFPSPVGPVTAQARLDGRQWSALRVGSSLGVRYRPLAPQDNLPDGATRPRRAWLWCGLALGWTLFCGLLLGGLVAARRRGLGIR